MKKAILLLFCAGVFTIQGFSQDEETEVEEKGFKKDRLFTGGSINLSFFNGTTVIGASPHFGYQIAKWIDGGLVFNYSYTGMRDVYQFDDKLRQTTYGGGVFMRVFPLKFLFAQSNLEHNFIKAKYLPQGGPTQRENYDATSLLVGGGYTQGRDPSSNSFFYLSILFDVLKNENSPYVDVVYDPVTGASSKRAIPIIRAGVNIGLFQGSRSRR